MKKLGAVVLLLALIWGGKAQDTLVKIENDFKQSNTHYLDYIERLTPAQYQSMDSLLRVICKNLNGTLLVAVDDSVLFCRATGYLKLYRKASYRQYSTEQRNNMCKAKTNALNTNTFFELASVSKQFTAAAVLKLVSEGKLSLQDTLRQFFPQLPYHHITLHHLLSHTSGLPEYFDFKQEYYDTSQLLTNNKLVSILAHRKPEILFQPGEKFKYINTNYALLAAIVAKVSGMKFETYVRQNLFVPAGMTQTFFITEKASKKQLRIATGHLRNGSEVAPYFMDGTVGDKGIYSNVNELFKWHKAYFLDYKILPENWVALATQQENYVNSGDSINELYGYGLRLKNSEEHGFYIYHGGLWRGYHHVWIYRPNDRFYAIFLSNFVNRAHKGRSGQLLEIKER
jgi:CubicO group peptidase (beta-lactamase class C family)